ncbi:high mobility group box domain-containing protein, partial [Gautieria morchelliformis]
RPSNAFILYRRAKLEELTLLRGMPQSEISKTIGKMWGNETPQAHTHYQRLSDDKKAEHKIAYPNYRFQPMKKADR